MVMIGWKALVPLVYKRGFEHWNFWNYYACFIRHENCKKKNFRVGRSPPLKLESARTPLLIALTGVGVFCPSCVRRPVLRLMSLTYWLWFCVNIFEGKGSDGFLLTSFACSWSSLHLVAMALSSWPNCSMSWSSGVTAVALPKPPSTARIVGIWEKCCS